MMFRFDKNDMFLSDQDVSKNKHYEMLHNSDLGLRNQLDVKTLGCKHLTHAWLKCNSSTAFLPRLNFECFEMMSLLYHSSSSP